jgi:pimeloyl-ACP methyl ester carboxylesterase
MRPRIWRSGWLEQPSETTCRATVTVVIRRRSLQLGAGEFSYMESGEGDPLLFLHALGRSASDWASVMEAMADTWWCLALDQRGHGDSVRCGEYTFEAMEQDFREFVDGLGLDRFFLVAHSMGGTVGWLFAEKTPERLQKLAFEDTPPPTDRHTYPDIPETPPEPVRYDWEARRQLFRQLNAPDPSWWANIERVTAPTLVIAGSATDDDLQETARRLPDGELIIIETGHWIHETQPVAFVAAIRAFLED